MSTVRLLVAANSGVSFGAIDDGRDWAGAERKTAENKAKTKITRSRLKMLEL